MQNYLINNRALTLYQDLKTELVFEPQKNYLFDLSYLGILDLIGDKAVDFLQGQVTSDVKKISDEAMLPGAMCNLKGRILTLFQACQYQGLKLVLPKDLIDETQKSLNQAAMLSRVKLQINSEYFVLGFYCQNPEDLHIPEEIPCFSFYLPQEQSQNDFTLLILNKENKTAIIDTFIAKNQFRGSLAWHTLTLLNNAVDIYPETRGEFLPHRLDLHHTEYLNFDKGCYKGQEIIARTHYRAVIKHELSLFTIESKDHLLSKQKIMDDSGKKEVGEIIDFSPINEMQFIVAATVLMDKPN